MKGGFFENSALYLKVFINMATRIPPPKPGNLVSKDYVRQQLKLLGIKSVAEEDLESYAAG